MKNADIAQIFNNIADLLEIKNENPFRIRAYRKAALNIGELGKDISSLSEEEVLEIPGIGHDLAAKIEEYVKSGHMEAYETLKHEVPESLIELLAIPGLGPKTVSLLYSKFDIKDVASLEKLAKAFEPRGKNPVSNGRVWERRLNPRGHRSDHPVRRVESVFQRLHLSLLFLRG